MPFSSLRMPLGRGAGGVCQAFALTECLCIPAFLIHNDIFSAFSAGWKEPMQRLLYDGTCIFMRSSACLCVCFCIYSVFFAERCRRLCGKKVPFLRTDGRECPHHAGYLSARTGRMVRSMLFFLLDEASER